MFQALLYVVNALLILAIIASVVCWVRILRHRRGMPLREKVESFLPSRSQERPYRSNADGLAIFVTASIMLFTTAVSFTLIREAMIERGWIQIAEPNGELVTEAGPDAVQPAPVEHQTANSLIASIAANSASGLIGVLVAVGWLGLFFRRPLRVIGLWPKLGDLSLGVKASLLILPPVLLISATASSLIPYEHPVLNSLAAFATPSVFLATVIGTAVIAPVVEELMLRGLLQGGLQRLADPPIDGDDWRPSSYWPIFGASGLFALMHLGQGAAPIPLFFLAVGLGYLYRQTGNLTAPIVVHMVLNSLTLLVELLKIQSS